MASTEERTEVDLRPWLKRVQGKPKEGSPFQIDTVVKTSLIPDAGLGRFTAEAVKKGSIVYIREKVHFPESDEAMIKALSRADITLVFSSADDLLRCAELLSRETGTDVTKIATEMSHFIFGVSGNTKQNFIHGSSCHFNHGFGEQANVENSETPTHIIVRSKRDLREGEEIYIDYGRYHINSFVDDFLSDFGLISVRTFVETLEVESVENARTNEESAQEQSARADSEQARSTGAVSIVNRALTCCF